jgi:hypothetical protein
MRLLTRIALIGAFMIAGSALAEAQTTTCTRMGIIMECNTTSPPAQQPIGGYGDAYNRGAESAARAEWLRQQTELLRRQNEQLRQAPVDGNAAGQCPQGYTYTRNNDAQGNFLYWSCDPVR